MRTSLIEHMWQVPASTSDALYCDCTLDVIEASDLPWPVNPLLVLGLGAAPYVKTQNKLFKRH